jgi:hypothetical protein
MRRDPKIINLYDRPLYPRPRFSAHREDRNEYGSALLACLAITVVIAGFFWIYDAIAHRGPPFVPVLSETVPAFRSRLANESPVPDMASPAVALANADVPEEQRAMAQATRPEPDATQSAKTAEPSPKKKPKIRVAKPVPPDAARGYASAPDFFRVPYGGF